MKKLTVLFACLSFFSVTSILASNSALSLCCTKNPDSFACFLCDFYVANCLCRTANFCGLDLNNLESDDAQNHLGIIASETLEDVQELFTKDREDGFAFQAALERGTVGRMVLIGELKDLGMRFENGEITSRAKAAILRGISKKANDIKKFIGWRAGALLLKTSSVDFLNRFSASMKEYDEKLQSGIDALKAAPVGKKKIRKPNKMKKMFRPKRNVVVSGEKKKRFLEPKDPRKSRTGMLSDFVPGGIYSKKGILYKNIDNKPVF